MHDDPISDPWLPAASPRRLPGWKLAVDLSDWWQFAVVACCSPPTLLCGHIEYEKNIRPLTSLEKCPIDDWWIWRLVKLWWRLMIRYKWYDTPVTGDSLWDSHSPRLPQLKWKWWLGTMIQYREVWGQGLNSNNFDGEWQGRIFPPWCLKWKSTLKYQPRREMFRRTQPTKFN